MLKSINEKLDDIKSEQSMARDEMRKLREDMTPWIEAYEGVLAGKRILIGLASVLAALGTIGIGIVWLLNYIRHG